MGILAISSGRKSSGKMQPQWRIAFSIRDPCGASILLVESSPPPTVDDFLLHFKDSALWELPNFPLRPRIRSELRGSSDHTQLVCAIEAALRDLGISSFDVLESVNEVQRIVSMPLQFSSVDVLTEPDFGPKHAIHTAIVFAETPRIDEPGNARWFSCDQAADLLNARPSANSERIGLLAANVLCGNGGLKLNVDYQEYPPGMLTVPMISRTLKPFSKTNLVIWSPNAVSDCPGTDGLLLADALIVDPGCSAPIHNELAAIVSSLPRKLLVLLTHHHLDHTDGLPAVEEANPDALVIAHEHTFQRLKTGLCGMKYRAVDGGTKLSLRGRSLEIIASPGHTDGHLCVFDCATRTLVAGDHCVGEGSSIIDPNSGGSLEAYMKTSHSLLELRPHLVVPMHGRPNFWPQHLLRGYIKHRRTREAKILKAIESGAATAFEIVSEAYKQTHVSFWPAAVLNVRSHVDYLQTQDKLPEKFCMQKFERSLGKPFLVRWMACIAGSYVSNSRLFSLVLVILAIFLYLYKR